ncbi:MAG: periplasmic protein TonB, partial [Alphaproteobacteria bacterium]
PPPPPAPTPPAPPQITAASFIERPNGRDFANEYPARAMEREKTGSVVLDCTVRADGRLNCVVASEDPPNWGFGDASLRIARRFKVRPQLANGVPTEGGRIRVPIRWNLE